MTKSPGRPRLYQTATERQKAYRHRKAAKERETSVPVLAARLHGALSAAATAGNSEAARLAGPTVGDTLARLAADAESRFGVASN